MSTADHHGTALITGASAGLGAEFARQLAAQGYSLALTARRADRLQALAAELQQAYGVSVQVLPADLASQAGVAAVETWIAGMEDLELLVNNAGYGLRGGFVRNPVEKELDMLQVHVVAAIRLAKAALAGMLQRNRGGIINVSSMAAFFPIRNTTYTSTKAYLVNFSEGLQSELWGTNIKVQALCSGFVHTEFHSTPEMTGFNPKNIPNLFWLNAPAVVADSLRNLAKGGVVCIPGWQYRAAALLLRSPLTSGLARRFVRFLYSRKHK
jgi:uncharacterized protein